MLNSLDETDNSMDLKLEGIYPKAQKYIDRDDTPRMTKCQRVESHDGTAWPKKEGKTFDPVLLLKLTALDETTKTSLCDLMVGCSPLPMCKCCINSYVLYMLDQSCCIKQSALLSDE